LFRVDVLAGDWVKKVPAVENSATRRWLGIHQVVGSVQDVVTEEDLVDLCGKTLGRQL
jgi:hypothetical protein